MLGNSFSVTINGINHNQTNSGQNGRGKRQKYHSPQNHVIAAKLVEYCYMQNLMTIDVTDKRISECRMLRLKKKPPPVAKHKTGKKPL